MASSKEICKCFSNIYRQTCTYVNFYAVMSLLMDGHNGTLNFKEVTRPIFEILIFGTPLTSAFIYPTHSSSVPRMKQIVIDQNYHSPSEEPRVLIT